MNQKKKSQEAFDSKPAESTKRGRKQQDDPLLQSKKKKSKEDLEEKKRKEQQKELKKKKKEEEKKRREALQQQRQSQLQQIKSSLTQRPQHSNHDKSVEEHDHYPELHDNSDSEIEEITTPPMCSPAYSLDDIVPITPSPSSARLASLSPQNCVPGAWRPNLQQASTPRSYDISAGRCSSHSSLQISVPSSTDIRPANHSHSLSPNSPASDSSPVSHHSYSFAPSPVHYHQTSTLMTQASTQASRERPLVKDTVDWKLEYQKLHKKYCILKEKVKILENQSTHEGKHTLQCILSKVIYHLRTTGSLECTYLKCRAFKKA